MSDEPREHADGGITAMSSDDPFESSDDLFSDELSRSAFLRRAGAAGIAIAAVPSWATSALASPGNRSAGSQTATVVVGVESIGADLMPPHSFQGWGHVTAVAHMFETLYAHRGWDVTQPVVPVLARDLPRRDRRNNRQYAVDLRRGVRFHDGTRFDAEAVVFNYERYIDKSHPFYDPGAVLTGTQSLIGVANVEALDADTVIFTINRPLGDFKAQLVPAFTGILSPTAIRAAGVANAGVAPVGTGPYRLVEARRGDHITIERFSGYWGSRPAVRQIIFRAIPDSAALTAAMLAGDVDLTWFTNPDDAPRFANNSKFNIARKTSGTAGYVMFNAGGSSDVTTFTDRRLRLAAMKAINKRKLLSLVLRGYGELGAGMNSPLSWGFNERLRDYHKNDKAAINALLRQVGDLPDVTLSVPATSIFPRLAESVQADWSAVGLKTDIRTIDPAAFGGQMSRGQHDAFLWDGTPLLFQPWTIGRALFGRTNPLRLRAGGWYSEDFDRAGLAAMASRNHRKAFASIAKMDRILLDQGVFQANYYPAQISVWNKRIAGFRPSGLRVTALHGIRVT